MAKALTGAELAKIIADEVSAEDLQKADLLSSVANEISNQRIARNLNQKQFAEFLGVSQGMISKWENGDYNFTLEKLADIFTKLNVEISMVFRSTVGFASDYSDSHQISADNNILDISFNTGEAA
jgi:Predicted transcriptional regulators